MEATSTRLYDQRIVRMLVFFMLLGLWASCSGSKAAKEAQNFGQLQELVNKQEFQIEHQWAMPLGGRNINLIGNNNFVRFSGDSVNIFLPYFGVRHSGGGYGGEGGIKYEGLAEEFQTTVHPQQKNIQLSFEGNHQNENLEFDIILYPNGSATTTVISSQRASISYRGEFRNE